MNGKKKQTMIQRLAKQIEQTESGKVAEAKQKARIKAERPTKKADEIIINGKVVD